MKPIASAKPGKIRVKVGRRTWLCYRVTSAEIAPPKQQTQLLINSMVTQVINIYRTEHYYEFLQNLDKNTWEQKLSV